MLRKIYWALQRGNEGADAFLFLDHENQKSYSMPQLSAPKLICSRISGLYPQLISTPGHLDNLSAAHLFSLFASAKISCGNQLSRRILDSPEAFSSSSGGSNILYAEHPGRSGLKAETVVLPY
jgi:hypothetical protein